MKRAKTKRAVKAAPARRAARVAFAATEDGLTQEIADRFVRAILKRNLPRKFAATYCGVSPKTAERWIAMGATGTGSALHVDLARRVYAVEGRKVGSAMTNLAILALKDAKAGETFLKFFKPGDFGGPASTPDEFEGLERHADRRRQLWTNPPPRMLREARDAGWWQFPLELDAGDRDALLALQEKYSARRAGALFTQGEKAP